MVFRISTKYKIYIALIILISISVSTCDSNSNSFLNYRRYCSSTCYCPKRDFWRSKYSEDVKFSLLSYEYRTHLKVLLDGSIVVEEGSPELLHGDNIWFTTCDKTVDMKEGSRFEICLAGLHNKKLVFDKINGNFKIIMFPEQLTNEFHHMNVEAQIYLDQFDEDNRRFLHLTIKPTSSESKTNKRYMLWIDKTKRVQNDVGSLEFQSKEVGRVSMVRIPDEWAEFDLSNLEIMFK